MRWDLKGCEVTQAVLDSENDIHDLDKGILSLSLSLERLLCGFLSLLNDRRNLYPMNRELECVFQRYILAAIAVSYLDDEKLERGVALNLHLPTLSNDGIDELLDTVDDIHDFYSNVSEPTSAMPMVETFTLEAKRS